MEGVSENEWQAAGNKIRKNRKSNTAFVSNKEMTVGKNRKYRKNNKFYKRMKEETQKETEGPRQASNFGKITKVKMYND